MVCFLTFSRCPSQRLPPDAGPLADDLHPVGLCLLLRVRRTSPDGKPQALPSQHCDDCLQPQHGFAERLHCLWGRWNDWQDVLFSVWDSYYMFLWVGMQRIVMTNNQTQTSNAFDQSPHSLFQTIFKWNIYLLSEAPPFVNKPEGLWRITNSYWCGSDT